VDAVTDLRRRFTSNQGPDRRRDGPARPSGYSVPANGSRSWQAITGQVPAAPPFGLLNELSASGAPGIEAALLRQGLPEAAVRAAVPGLLGPAGLSTSPEVTLHGMEAVAALRRRFTADWRPACPLTSLIGPGQRN
jgi:hypothetical protein